ncbi:polysaccharide pyruvyl transferase family protein [Luteimonas viscosa]|uniref:Polysaccharide pyruvyl transferase family protein n=1 Tax=Luteimonas viscosa TaxID=1132694 RepID=A0A5D4XR59_9GAMM|nr:polysaccharide pyruvyl transferase family protein [Luteimonas viscosa]TYT27136.1 polysaccharide pyruvyl transferase family protein [Luteimonas viscosa]
MKKKRIGLVGFFGWGNFGDELFVDVYRQWLEPEFELKVLNDLTQKPYFSRPVPEVLEDVDAVVIGGGDLIMPWTVSDLYWKKEYLTKPVHVCGVGVPTWKGSAAPAVEYMREFLSHPNIRYFNVRDRESANWINKHIKPATEPSHGADIVFALDMPSAPKPEGAPILGVVTRDRSDKPDDLTNVLALCQKALGLGYRIRHIVLGSGVVGRKDVARAQDLDIPGKELVVSESTADLCKAIGECTALTSMKFHGTVVAAAYGVPSFVLSATDKSRNLMRMMERPDLLTSIADKHLPDRFSQYTPPIPWATRNLLRRRAEATLNELAESLRSC